MKMFLYVLILSDFTFSGSCTWIKNLNPDQATGWLLIQIISLKTSLYRSKNGITTINNKNASNLRLPFWIILTRDVPDTVFARYPARPGKAEGYWISSWIYGLTTITLVKY
jgi:hypothetical protein